MRVLVVGNGAREHTLVWKLALSPQVDEIFCAPGNAGTGIIARNVPISPKDHRSLASWARTNGIDLTIVGPERPLIEGIVDVFRFQELPIFGPTAKAAAIEGSKVWTKELLIKHGIPTARAQVVTEYTAAEDALDRCSFPVAVKADGDAAGKGVVIARDRDEARAALKSFMVDRAVGAAGDRVLLEEFMEGVELSVLTFTDGRTIVPMAPACDYKRVGDGDSGPNTGGMGSYAPPGFATPELMSTIQKTILEPTVAAMEATGCPYSGVLYAGLMITADGPKVMEFNCRMGDPETQVVLPLLKSDLAEITMAVADGRLDRQSIEWEDAACCGVVMASAGYPGDFRQGVPIEGLDALDDGALVFHGGTKVGADPRHKDPWANFKKELMIAPAVNSSLLTAGGRVLTVVAKAPTLGEAREKVYQNVRRISFDGAHYRTDIALREIEPAPRQESRGREV